MLFSGGKLRKALWVQLVVTAAMQLTYINSCAGNGDRKYSSTVGLVSCRRAADPPVCAGL